MLSAKLVKDVSLSLSFIQILGLFFSLANISVFSSFSENMLLLFTFFSKGVYSLTNIKLQGHRDLKPLSLSWYLEVSFKNQILHDKEDYVLNMILWNLIAGMPLMSCLIVWFCFIEGFLTNNYRLGFICLIKTHLST